MNEDNLGKDMKEEDNNQPEIVENDLPEASDESDADLDVEESDAEDSSDDAPTILSDVGAPTESVGEEPESDSDNGDDHADELASDPIVVEETFVQDVGHLHSRDLRLEMETSYLDYAMSVIVSRALPDVRDGLKPVHRRVLYAMHSTGLHHNVKYRKSAKVVGEVIGNFHPHGDVAAYDTLVRMAQDFSMRYPMVDGQGNFGSMDGDSAAAMRYTECRMSSIAGEMLADIDKDTVDWQDNYDGTTQEPKVLPARVPQLLLNGTMGIAVGMATNIPPHNLGELCGGVVALIDNPDATVDDLMEHVKGPDFPTGANIYNTEDIKLAYATGKGKIMMRAKAEIEEAKRGFRIIISEIPYQVNKATMIEKIADLVKNKKIDGISDLRDESDRKGVRVVIELKANSYPKKVLNRLFELTPMQTAFHVNMLALTPDLEPRVMTLRDVLLHYIDHRKIVIARRSEFELKKAKDRAHILEGLRIALDQIDKIINTIRASANKEEAKKNLISEFALSEKQTDAILEMRLSALAALERKKIEDEYEEMLKRIAFLEDILAHPEKILGLIKQDLKEVVEKFGDERRTTIIPHALGDFSAEDLIPNQSVIVALSRGNYIKRQEVDTYRKQTRGGIGVVGMTTKEEDIVDHLVCANTHDDIYLFTNKGRVFKSKVYELPASGRQSKGTPVINIVQIASSEKVTALLTVAKNNNGDKYFVMGTKDGQIKKTEIEKYENIRKTGIIAMGLKGADELKWVKTSIGDDVIVEVSQKGQAICYPETDVRPMGRSASGVTGMRMKSGDQVMAMEVIPKSLAGFEPNSRSADILVVLENGFGKRTMLKNFHLQKRGGMGIKAANCTPKTGNLIGIHVTYNDLGDVILASEKGQFIRMELNKIKRLGRDTQGVTLMRLKDNDKVSSVAIIMPEEDKPEETTPKEEHRDTKDDKKDKSLKTIPSGPKKAPISKSEDVAKPKEEKLKSTNQPVKVHYYERNGSDNTEEEKTEMPNEKTENSNESFHIKSYKNETDDTEPTTDQPEDTTPKNPPMQKDNVNYWGGNKHK